MKERSKMKRFPILGLLLLIPALGMFSVVGCKKDDPDKDKGAQNGGKNGALKAAVDITTPTDAIVKGVVTFKGDPPKAVEDKRIKDHKEGPACLAGKAIDKQEQTWIVSDDG